MARVRYDNAQLRRYISTMPDAGQRVVERTAEVAVDRIKQRAPVDTGALRDSVSHRSDGPLREMVEEASPYGIYQEFGTWKQAPQPHFIPGMGDAAQELPRIAAEEFRP